MLALNNSKLHWFCCCCYIVCLRWHHIIQLVLRYSGDYIVSTGDPLREEIPKHSTKAAMFLCCPLVVSSWVYITVQPCGKQPSALIQSYKGNFSVPFKECTNSLNITIFIYFLPWENPKLGPSDSSRRSWDASMETMEAERFETYKLFDVIRII